MLEDDSNNIMIPSYVQFLDNNIPKTYEGTWNQELDTTTLRIFEWNGTNWVDDMDSLKKPLWLKVENEQEKQIENGTETIEKLTTKTALKRSKSCCRKWRAAAAMWW